MLEALYNAIRRDAKPEEVTIGGRKYTTAQVYPVTLKAPGLLTVTTLSGFVDYINDNVDKHEIGNLLCHVESPNSVALYSALLGDFNQRFAYLRAENEQLQLPLNQFIPAEKFNLLLQSCFVEPDDEAKATDRGLVLRYSANVKTVVEGAQEDNGVTQTVTAKAGIASVRNEPMPNPVLLRPYRTFVEVEQPASKFVFRARSGEDGVSFNLVEADGGAWKGEAMQNIKNYLKKTVPSLNIIA